MKSTRALMTNQYLELEQELVISQCSWLTQPSLAAPYSHTAEEQERSRRLYEHIILFLQDNGLTTRRILAEGEQVTDETAIRVGDLTPRASASIPLGSWLGSIDTVEIRIRTRSSTTSASSRRSSRPSVSKGRPRA